MAVRFTIWRGGCSVTAGASGTGRTSTTTDSVTRSCQPRRIRPVSITAVQARVAAPSPKVGSVATPRIRVRWIAGSTPIGVPVPRCTTRSPSAAFPGDVPTLPRTTAKTSPTSSSVPMMTRIAAPTPPLEIRKWYAAQATAATIVQAISRSRTNA